MLNLVPFHIQAHLNKFLQILEYFSQSVDVDDLNLIAFGASSDRITLYFVFKWAGLWLFLIYDIFRLHHESNGK